MEVGGGELRRRKGGLREIVEDLDAFTKVVDDIKEEKSAASGIISVVVFGIIAVLCLGELHAYFFGAKEFDYRFDVDVDYLERPRLDIDMVVATACSGLVVMPTGEVATYGDTKDLSKDPTRFEFTDDEQLYWTVLRHAYDSMGKDGFRGLDELMFVDDDVEKRLKTLADAKQNEEIEAIKKQRKENKQQPGQDAGMKVFLVGNGFGVFHLVASSGTGNNDEGNACRIHGSLPVSKGKSNKVIIAVGDMGIGNIIASFGGGLRKGNVSHRIERFHFGRRVNGLVAPLAGAEQISPSGRETYRYFVKIVPTRIYHNRLFGGSTLAYQYSVTFLKKQAERDEYPGGAIVFDYEFTSTIIEIREVATSLVQLLLRLCSVVGGVFATSCIINGIVQLFIHCFCCDRKAPELPVSPHPFIANPSLAKIEIR